MRTETGTSKAMQGARHVRTAASRFSTMKLIGIARHTRHLTWSKIFATTTPAQLELGREGVAERSPRVEFLVGNFGGGESLNLNFFLVVVDWTTVCSCAHKCYLC